MLFADGKEIPASFSATNDELISAVLSSDALRRRSEQFASCAVRPVPEGRKSVFVLQQEVCSLHIGKESDAVVGSEDATTCAIAVLIANNVLTLIHLDEPLSKDLPSLERLTQHTKDEVRSNFLCAALATLSYRTICSYITQTV